ncbi:hypothetical protein [uncultured Bacteroides sp.]|uniref:hypothetical protein n=1 Tax=uncultured Bacteroides sp. TaxID=162156 RepID=UPI002AA8121D|nr:hypothetical protein [uncultured Bacteroides sp.]
MNALIFIRKKRPFEEHYQFRATLLNSTNRRFYHSILTYLNRHSFTFTSISMDMRMCTCTCC